QRIEALEADDIDALPDPVFARALAASVCRALRIDPKPVLSKLPGAPRPGVGETQRAMSASFHTGVQRSNGSMVSRSVLTVVGLLLVGAAALFFLPQSWLDELAHKVDGVLARGADTGKTEALMPPAEAPGVPAVAVEPVVPQPAASAVGAPAPLPAGPQVAGVPAAAAGAVANAVATPAAAPAQLLSFNARSETWVSVTEAGGKQLLQRNLAAGESIGLAGTPPLSVVVGRASGVEVQVRGKPFDLAPLTRAGGVARFEVKP
ncbi:MAG: RodZ domain-containing protein, partial [Variovorax sp.]